tara:strand:+ start:375 stop:1133 length:759 start_codon:yes stop_codon:yes gene_type:complete
MSAIYNIGCSFSYGNCIHSYQTYAQDKLGNHIHISPADIIREELDNGWYDEVINLASPGLSLDGVLRRLYSYNINDGNNLVLVGLPPSDRFQTVAINPREEHKVRGLFSTATKWKADAFHYGPSLEIYPDWFRTHRWTSNRLKGIDVDYQLLYHSWMNILLIQKRLRDLNVNYYMYNTVYSPMIYETELTELNNIKSQISNRYYFQPNQGMKDLIDTDEKWQISKDDNHPNHSFYAVWCKKLIEFINENPNM